MRVVTAIDIEKAPQAPVGDHAGTKKAALNRDWIFFAIDLCRSSG
jgi:hypothetical protein